MANAVYPIIREKLLEWVVDDSVPAAMVLRVVGVGSGYAYNAAHEDASSVADIVIPATTIANVTQTGRVLNGDDLEVTGFDPTDSLTGLIVYWSYTGGTTLVCYIDTTVDGSIPQLLEGTSLVYRWNASGIVSI